MQFPYSLKGWIFHCLPNSFPHLQPEKILQLELFLIFATSSNWCFTFGQQAFIMSGLLPPFDGLPVWHNNHISFAGNVTLQITRWLENNHLSKFLLCFSVSSVFNNKSSCDFQRTSSGHAFSTYRGNNNIILNRLVMWLILAQMLINVKHRGLAIYNYIRSFKIIFNSDLFSTHPFEMPHARKNAATYFLCKTREERGRICNVSWPLLQGTFEGIQQAIFSAYG